MAAPLGRPEDADLQREGGALSASTAAPRTALVTGTSRGLGREVVRQLAARGMRVIATSRCPDAAAAAADLAGAPGRVEGLALDVARPESVWGLAERLRERGDVVDVLVNNAGVALDGFDADIAQRTLGVNLFGALRVTRALLERIPKGGRVVMVSSGMGELAGLPPAIRERFVAEDLTEARIGQLAKEFVAAVREGRHERAGWPSSAYRVSKVALNALTRVLARELEPRGVSVDAVCPGWVRTDMGGPSAPVRVEDGARGIVWVATRPDGGTAGFYRDRAPIGW